MAARTSPLKVKARASSIREGKRMLARTIEVEIPRPKVCAAPHDEPYTIARIVTPAHEGNEIRRLSRDRKSTWQPSTAQLVLHEMACQAYLARRKKYEALHVRRAIFNT